MRLAVLVIDLTEGIDGHESNAKYEYGTVSEGLGAIEQVVSAAAKRSILVFGVDGHARYFVNWGGPLDLSARFKQYVRDGYLYTKDGRAQNAMVAANNGVRYLKDGLSHEGVTQILPVGFDRDYCMYGTIKGGLDHSFELITSETLMLTGADNEPSLRDRSMNLFTRRTTYKSTPKDVLAYLGAIAVP